MAYDSWYCGLPGWISDRFESCIMTEADQIANMNSNFGASIDPTLKQTAIQSFDQYLKNTDYSKSINDLVNTDKLAANPLNPYNLSGIMPVVIAIGGIGLLMVLLGDGGPRRYGR